jgi:hypothetical protein
MSYVAVGVLFLLIASGFITYLVLSATRNSSNQDDGATPRVGADHTPFGDTAQHAGTQTAAGETTDHADETGTDPGPQNDPPPGRFKRDPIGGEAEAEPAIPAEPPRTS